MKSLMCNNCDVDELSGFACSQDRQHKRGTAVKLSAGEAELLAKKDLLIL